jgi:hypothetical protein
LREVSCKLLLFESITIQVSFSVGSRDSAIAACAKLGIHFNATPTVFNVYPDIRAVRELVLKATWPLTR